MASSDGGSIRSQEEEEDGDGVVVDVQGILVCLVVSTATIGSKREMGSVPGACLRRS